MKDFITSYDKQVDYADYATGYQEAVLRASKLDEIAALDRDDGRNPTTGMYQLTESIRNAS